MGRARPTPRRARRRGRRTRACGAGRSARSAMVVQKSRPVSSCTFSSRVSCASRSRRVAWRRPGRSSGSFVEGRAQDAHVPRTEFDRRTRRRRASPVSRSVRRGGSDSRSRAPSPSCAARAAGRSSRAGRADGHGGGQRRPSGRPTVGDPAAHERSGERLIGHGADHGDPAGAGLL